MVNPINSIDNNYDYGIPQLVNAQGAPYFTPNRAPRELMMSRPVVHSGSNRSSASSSPYGDSSDSDVSEMSMLPPHTHGRLPVNNDFEPRQPSLPAPVPIRPTRPPFMLAEYAGEIVPTGVAPAASVTHPAPVPRNYGTDVLRHGIRANITAPVTSTSTPLNNPYRARAQQLVTSHGIQGICTLPPNTFDPPAPWQAGDELLTPAEAQTQFEAHIAHMRYVHECERRSALSRIAGTSQAQTGPQIDEYFERHLDNRVHLISLIRDARVNVYHEHQQRAAAREAREQVPSQGRPSGEQRWQRDLQDHHARLQQQAMALRAQQAHEQERQRLVELRQILEDARRFQVRARLLQRRIAQHARERASSGNGGTESQSWFAPLQVAFEYPQNVNSQGSDESSLDPRMTARHAEYSPAVRSVAPNLTILRHNQSNSSLTTPFAGVGVQQQAMTGTQGHYQTPSTGAFYQSPYQRVYQSPYQRPSESPYQREVRGELATTATTATTAMTNPAGISHTMPFAPPNQGSPFVGNMSAMPQELATAAATNRTGIARSMPFVPPNQGSSYMGNNPNAPIMTTAQVTRPVQPFVSRIPGVPMTPTLSSGNNNNRSGAFPPSRGSSSTFTAPVEQPFSTAAHSSTHGTSVTLPPGTGSSHAFTAPAAPTHYYHQPAWLAQRHNLLQPRVVSGATAPSMLPNNGASRGVMPASATGNQQVGAANSPVVHMPNLGTGDVSRNPLHNPSTFTFSSHAQGPRMIHGNDNAINLRTSQSNNNANYPTLSASGHMTDARLGATPLPRSIIVNPSSLPNSARWSTGSVVINPSLQNPVRQGTGSVVINPSLHGPVRRGAGNMGTNPGPHNTSVLGAGNPALKRASGLGLDSSAGPAARPDAGTVDNRPGNPVEPTNNRGASTQTTPPSRARPAWMAQLEAADLPPAVISDQAMEAGRQWRLQKERSATASGRLPKAQQRLPISNALAHHLVSKGFVKQVAAAPLPPSGTGHASRPVVAGSGALVPGAVTQGLGGLHPGLPHGAPVGTQPGGGFTSRPPTMPAATGVMGQGGTHLGYLPGNIPRRVSGSGPGQGAQGTSPAGGNDDAGADGPRKRKAEGEDSPTGNKRPRPGPQG